MMFETKTKAQPNLIFFSMFLYLTLTLTIIVRFVLGGGLLVPSIIFETSSSCRPPSFARRKLRSRGTKQALVPPPPTTARDFFFVAKGRLAALSLPRRLAPKICGRRQRPRYRCATSHIVKTILFSDDFKLRSPAVHKKNTR